MQIYADVTGREMKVSRSAQTCALGSAMAGAVVAGKKAGGYDNFDQARKAMTGVKPVTYKPKAANVKVYRGLYKLYRQIHDAFGVADNRAALANVMKDLLKIKESANA
jgi:L-ribulokinase